MTVSGSEHRQMVDVFLGWLENNNVPTNIPDILKPLAAIAPHANGDDFDKASEDARGIWEEKIMVDKAELEALEQLGTLFEGMPAGLALLECAIIKARQGNELAIAYCRQEGEQF
ncbi:hypothetical protein [Agrobacterium radiobacter]|uniref:hypothetical protein n=1 Tax=Agrobacterium radiobacter TaxID=362 RepID=UPI001605EB1C|nr:hypothetical protein [Agrobacterium radiobacter]MBB4407077.1 hypothetical protein [Agrobacterium radiobacter]MBB4452719.1 hypothetical protein [Agrobacterium radiobacter]